MKKEVEQSGQCIISFSACLSVSPRMLHFFLLPLFNVFIHLIKTHHRYMVLNHGGGLNLGMTETPTLHALLRAPNLSRLMRAHTCNLCHQLLLSYRTPKLWKIQH